MYELINSYGVIVTIRIQSMDQTELFNYLLYVKTFNSVGKILFNWVSAHLFNKLFIYSTIKHN